MNDVYLDGNLVADPSMQVVGEKKVALAKFSLAVKGQGKDAATSFVDLEGWDTTAEIIGKNFVKGQYLSLVGTLKQNSWQDKKTGQKISKLVVKVNKVLNAPAFTSKPVVEEVEYQGSVPTF